MIKVEHNSEPYPNPRPYPSPKPDHNPNLTIEEQCAGAQYFMRQAIFAAGKRYVHSFLLHPLTMPVI